MQVKQAFFSTIMRPSRQLELPENWVLSLRFWVLKFSGWVLKFWCWVLGLSFDNLDEFRDQFDKNSFCSSKIQFYVIIMAKKICQLVPVLPEIWVLNKNLEFWWKIGLSFEILEVLAKLSFDENVEKKPGLQWIFTMMIKRE